MDEEEKSACFDLHLETIKLEESQIKVDIGKIRSKSTTSLNLSWVIHNYFSLPQEPGWSFVSPEFTFLGAKWWLYMELRGSTSNGSSDRIAIFLLKERTGTPIHHFSCKMSIEKKNCEMHVIDNSQQCAYHVPSVANLDLSELLQDKDEIMLNGYLTIHCMLKEEDGKTDLSDVENDRGATTVEVVKDSKAESSLPEEKGTLSNPAGAGITTEEVEKDSKTVCSLAEEKDTLSNPTGTFKLAQDLKELLLKGSHFDTAIKIKNREFRAHRAILSSRSPVFGAMFGYDTTERNTGTIEIKDCEPDEFQEFLSFLYSGVLENLTSENVLNLYTVADKYDVQEVKAQCLDFMTNNLSVDYFCDVITLALRHNESQLLETAQEFFVQNTKKIVVTVKWLSFHKEYPVESNELYIKLLDHRDRQCDCKNNG